MKSRLLCSLLCAFCAFADTILAEPNAVRVTTWNLEWFPNGSPKEATPEEQNRRINEATNVLKRLKPDILLLQEVRDYTACARLGEAVEAGAYQIAICSAFKGGSQQQAILARSHAQAAWAEPWTSMEGIDPPRGFALAWLKLGKLDVAVYSVHLKSNLIMHGNKEVESARNIRKREVAARSALEAHPRCDWNQNARDQKHCGGRRF